jgi:cytochrome c6
MKSFLSAVCIAVFLVLSIVMVSAEGPAKAKADSKAGEELFKKHCAVCHPGGGNTINSKRPIGKKALAARNITTPEQMVKIMRNPAPPMVKFDEKTLPDKDAKAIAEYVLNTFK